MRGLTDKERAAIDPSSGVFLPRTDPVWNDIAPRQLGGLGKPFEDPTHPGLVLRLFLLSPLGEIALRADADARAAGVWPC